MSGEKKKPQVLVAYLGAVQHMKSRLQDKYCDINNGVQLEDTSAGYLTAEQLEANVAGRDVIAVLPLHQVNSRLLDLAGPRLKLVVLFSAGYEHVDLEECKKRGVAVCNCQGIIGKGVANLALGLATAVRRDVLQHNDYVKSGKWRQKGMFAETKARVDLLDSVAGIVGMGDIGFQVLRRLLAADVSRVLYSGNSRKPHAEELGAEFVSFSDLLRESDSVFVCCALNEQTRKMFNAEAFAQMKPGSVLVNVARGPIVDHDALYRALAGGHLHGAALDVTDPEPFPSDHPLCKIENCLIGPHVGGVCEPTVSLVVKTCCDNIEAWLSGNSVRNRLC